MDKQQKKLITEIMNEDAKDGLYQQTAVDWLINEITTKHDKSFIEFYSAEIEQAKQMEKEQLNIARLDGINLANKGYGK